jgi:hypothetical protein
MIPSLPTSFPEVSRTEDLLLLDWERARNVPSPGSLEFGANRQIRPTWTARPILTSKTTFIRRPS